MNDFPEMSDDEPLDHDLIRHINKTSSFVNPINRLRGQVLFYPRGHKIPWIVLLQDVPISSDFIGLNKQSWPVYKGF